MTIIRSLLMRLDVGGSILIDAKREQVENAAANLGAQYRRLYAIDDTEHGVRAERLANSMVPIKGRSKPKKSTPRKGRGRIVHPSRPKDWRTELSKLRVGQSLGFKYKIWDIFVGSIKEFERSMGCKLEIEHVPDNYAYVTRRR